MVSLTENIIKSIKKKISPLQKKHKIELSSIPKIKNNRNICTLPSPKRRKIKGSKFTYDPQDREENENYLNIQKKVHDHIVMKKLTKGSHRESSLLSIHNKSSPFDKYLELFKKSTDYQEIPERNEEDGLKNQRISLHSLHSYAEINSTTERKQ